MKTALEQLEELLWEAADERKLDWDIECKVAFECCWSVEVRITLDPNASGPDVSTVFLLGGLESPEDGAARMLEPIKEFLEKTK